MTLLHYLRLWSWPAYGLIAIHCLGRNSDLALLLPLLLLLPDTTTSNNNKYHYHNYNHHHHY